MNIGKIALDQELHLSKTNGISRAHECDRSEANLDIRAYTFYGIFVTSTTALSLEFSHFKSKSRDEIRNREHKYFVTLDNFASRLHLQQGQLNTMRRSLKS